MEVNWTNLIFNSILLGIGLAMDAFSVSLANGLNEPRMRTRKLFAIAVTFALFQAAMPLLGWVAVSGFVELFYQLKIIIPWVAFILLCFIGGKMLYESIKKKPQSESDGKRAVCELTVGALLLQAVATSIDALTAGITLAEDLNLNQYLYVLLSVGIIALITFVICACGVKLGQKVGTHMSGKAGILGGAVLIFLGIKIFVSDILLG